ncbi:MAG: glycosyltransferase family 4 protein, partial [Bacteroidota bacterium]
ALIAICPSYVKRLGVAGHKTHVVLNPFGSGNPAAAAPETSILNRSPAHGGIRLLLVGARQEKGLLEAMRAVNLIRDAHLTVAGRTHATLVQRSWSSEDTTLNGYQRRVVRWIEQNPEAARRIHFLGEVPGIAEAMRDSDVVLIPWMMPHFSRPMFEAWLMHRPVVVFDTEGVVEFCEDEVNAMVVPRGDWRAMASAVERLKVDRALRQQLVENGHFHARSLVNDKNSAQAILRVYEQVAVDW